MRLRTQFIAVTVAIVAGFGVAALAAPGAAQARTFYLGSSMFDPNYAEEGSGVSVEFFNVDSVPHRVVSYKVYGAETWSLDITLAPWESYTVPQSFTCVYPTCSYAASYLFRDPDRSRVVVGYGYSYCSGYCGKLYVHR